MEYLAKFPDSSKRSIAKKLCEDFPLLYNDIEDARYVVRKMTNSASKKHRTWVKAITHTTNYSAENPFGLPGK